MSEDEILSKYNIKMKKLIFGDIEVSKKEFYENKEGIKLKDVIVDNIIISNKIKGNNEVVKYYIGILLMIM